MIHRKLSLRKHKSIDPSIYLPRSSRGKVDPARAPMAEREARRGL